ncbi:hypothetical protein BDN70DRAFT_878879 [Pholiota conissans]|uniref:Uncharacterized protein n=1 Tax=Pholiota conissans TaxID=109636 RepID=A0A9P5Z214_9AGAR|nr:hypothetical protein BDN70DRAFT_878879 [Pholiota conissans]
MIIPDETAKTPIVEESEVQERSRPSISQYTPLQPEGESPPAYYGSNAQPTYLPRNTPYDVEDQASHSHQRRRSPGARLLRGLLIACIIWTLMALVFGSFTLLKRERKPNDWEDSDNHDGAEEPDRTDPKPHFEYDIPSGLLLSDCVQGSAWIPHWSDDSSMGAHAAFDLSLEDAELFLISRGQLSSGTLDVITSPTQPSNTVRIVVDVHYAVEEAREMAMACKMARALGDEPEGVGIFTPRWRNEQTKRAGTISFETTVIFPEVAVGAEPLFVKTFTVEVPNTVQRFADINEKVRFGFLMLRASNEPIEVKSLNALNADVRNKNAHVRGIFNTTSSLVLETTNSLIEADVGLHSVNGSSPIFFAQSTNGPIDASFSLTSDTTTTNPSYSISTTTSNSDALIHIPNQPINSILYLTTTATNGPAHVFLNRAFEGGIWLESPGAIVIKEDKAVEDPSGARRKRIVAYKSGKRQGKQVIAGSVIWGAEGSPRWGGAAGHGDGVVTIRNSNAPLTLEL